MRKDQISDCVCSELVTIRGSLGNLRGINSFLQNLLWPNLFQHAVVILFFFLVLLKMKSA